MIKFMIKLLKPKAKMIFLFSVISLFSTIISIMIPYYNGMFIDLITSTPNKNVVISFAIFIGSMSMTSIVVNYGYGILESKVKLDVSYTFYKRIVEHYQKIPLNIQKRYNSTYLNQRVNTDISIISNFFLRYYINIFIQITSLIILILLIFKLNIYIFIATMIIIPIYIWAYLKFKTPLYKEGILNKESSAEYFKTTTDQLELKAEIKSNSLYESSNRMILEGYKKYFSAAMKYAKVSYLFKLADNTITTMLNISILIIGGFEIINNNLSLGQFVIITSYYGMIFSAINFLLNVAKEYQDTKNSYHRIDEILSIPIEQNGQINVDKINQIDLNNIFYAYGNSEIIKNMTLKFKKGTPYVINGANGRGKTTLLSILVGVLKIDRGTIYYNDLEMEKVDMIKSRKDNISMYIQNAKHFDGTVIDNINYYLNINKEDIILKIKENNLEKLFLSKQFNIEEYFNKNIYELSGGERQKINLLCVLLNKKDVLILDEPTSNIDEVSSRLLSEYIESISSEIIVLIVTHDKKFLNNFKNVIGVNL